MHISNKSIFKKIIQPLALFGSLALSSFTFADKPPFPDITLPEVAQGQRAIQLLAENLPSVAASLGMSTSEFAKMIRTDSTLWLDKKGRVFYVDNEVDSSATIPETQAASSPYSETFKLHSKPESNRVIYLEFTGFVTSGTAWASGATINSPAFTLDADTTNFSNTEMDVIQNVWERVAEDYAPFNVDVTTEDPGEAAMTRSSSSDQNYGSRALITTHDSRLCSSCGGVAYVGVFDSTGNNYKPAFVFYNKLGSNAKNIAEATSHEVGHNLGLSHDGTSTTSYYRGHGNGATSWSSIMGSGYYKELTQWSKGEYNDANQSQDDIVIIQQNGALLITDDHGDNFDSNTTALTITPGTVGSSNISGKGIISQPTDFDVFSFTSSNGNILINVDPLSTGTNLDMEVSLHDSVGNLVASSNPLEATNASISITNLAAGDYYLQINGAGKGQALSDGYTDYGSLGQYSISGTIPESSNLQAPVSVITPMGVITGFAPLSVNLDALNSLDSDGSIISYNWNFDDNGATGSNSVTNHVFNKPGDYTVTLTVTDNDGLTGTSSIVVYVNNQLPIANAAASTLSGNAPVAVSFSSAGSYDPDTSQTLSYSWNFGDGTISSSANPTHEYVNAGTYTSVLTVTDELGATATDSIEIVIVVTADPDTAPVAPSALSANLNISGKGKNKTIEVSLSWIDNSDNEDSFVVERCKESGKGKNKVCNFSDLATMPANSTKYSESITSGAYKYRVRARNSFGENISNEVNVRTK